MITLCIIIFLIACYIDADDKDKRNNRKHDREDAERRHKEMMTVMKNRKHKVTRRRIVKKGDVTLGEEIVEEEE